MIPAPGLQSSVDGVYTYRQMSKQVNIGDYCEIALDANHHETNVYELAGADAPEIESSFVLATLPACFCCGPQPEQAAASHLRVTSTIAHSLRSSTNCIVRLLALGYSIKHSRCGWGDAWCCESSNGLMLTLTAMEQVVAFKVSHPRSSPLSSTEVAQSPSYLLHREFVSHLPLSLVKIFLVPRWRVLLLCYSCTPSRHQVVRSPTTDIDPRLGCR